jgi:hypothetical protein
MDTADLIVASGVLKALSIEEAGGERFILCGGVISEQDYCDVSGL